MPFTALRNLLAIVVIFMSVPVYLSLGIDRRLPKRIFLPLIVFILWSIISTWLFPALVGMRVYGLLMAALQVVIGMLPFFLNRNGNERCLTMSPPQFAVPFFSLRNTVAFCAANVFVIPVVLLLLTLTVSSAYMAHFTSGFVNLTPGGLTMTERIYTRGNRTIRLAAMIHVGDKGYYDGIANSAEPGRSIVLAEGVSDDEQLMRNRIDYGKVAGFLGLKSQEKLLFRGRLIDEEEFESPGPRTSGSNKQLQPEPPDIFRADMDISDFKPQTVLFLNAIGERMQNSPSFLKGFLALNDWSKKNITPEISTIIMDDILDRRNLCVLSRLDKALEHYDTVIIPWGALHMKGIEVDILKRGFVLQKERKRVSIDFGRMLL